VQSSASVSGAAGESSRIVWRRGWWSTAPLSDHGSRGAHAHSRHSARLGGPREGVGRVAELGAGTCDVAVGQLVLLPVGCGSWSTHVVTEAAQLTPLPSEADPLQLSMMTINPPTAALLLREFVTLGQGDWVIQNAANSAVGLYLVQLARHCGHRTVNVVRREGAATAVRQAGGDAVLVDGEDLAQRVTEVTGGAQIRLGIDAVAGTATGRLAGRWMRAPH
jgi:mitochondrial enoyl-[acyl-carrier protein] reductase / trans-2-enoyl-CoA reductase